MHTAKSSDAPLLPLLRAWVKYTLAHFKASLKPRHGAEQIAALVAAGGDPTGV
ncbi:hypothetical protein [Alsobacter sp. SYSU BS001988]